MSTTFLKFFKKNFETPQILILCGFTGKKNYFDVASGWKKSMKMIQ
jgi:hypothetical protein